MTQVEMIRSLLEGRYKLGEPWKLPRGAGFVLPLLGEPQFPERNYVLLQEVEDQVEFKDSGGISGVDALNKSGKIVYVRKGTLLTGEGTQSRSPVFSVVLLPEKEFVEIPVNCIHASHGISFGASFKPKGVAPVSVYQSLGMQSETWQSIEDYTGKMKRSMLGAGRAAPPEAEAMRSIAEDDLVSVSEAVTRLQAKIDDVLSKIPGDHVDQVGVAVFDLDGVVGVEFFDHSDSWRAFSESILRSYGEVLTKEVGELYDIRMDRAAPVLMAFLERVTTANMSVVSENRISNVSALTGDDVTGELTYIEGREVHIALARLDDEGGGGSARVVASVPHPVSEALNELASKSKPEGESLPVESLDGFLSKRGGYSILDQLSDRAQRFGELVRSVSVSRGTLATRLREAEDEGLIQRAIRKENGSPAYALTEKGEEVKKKGEDKVV
jgi:DNA-binding HxlR family transcriptional regulator